MKFRYLAALLISCFVIEAKQHPFLLTTRENIRSARSAVSTNDEMKKLADDLVTRARLTDLEKLPELDFRWYENPQNINYVSRHTYHLPRPWALRAQDCARASIFEPQYAEKAKEILLHLANYGFAEYPFNDALNHARVFYPALDAYDIIYNKLSADERKIIDYYFKRMTDAIIEDHNRWVATNPGGVPVNNHICWHNLAMAMYGAFYDKPELINRAIYGKRGMEFMFNFGFRDSGLWGEASIAYHFVALEPILIMAEMLENIGYSVSLYEPTSDGRDLKQAYDSFFELLFANLDLPRVGDTYGRQPKISAGLAFEVLYRRFGDDKYAWLINKQEKRDASALFYGKPAVRQVPQISQYSTLLPEQGYAFLRTNEGDNYWNGKGWTLMASYSDVYVHRHLDKLSIILFGNNHHWLIDANMGFTSGIDWDIVKSFSRHTISHNTIMVDDKLQNDLTRRLDLVEYSSLPDVKRISIADYSSQLYPGVKQMRTCIVNDDYVLDVFQTISKTTHKYSWIAHIAAEEKECSISNFTAKKLTDNAPWKYLLDAKESSSQFEQMYETFSNGKDDFRIDLFVNRPSKILKAGYPLDNSPNTEKASELRIASCEATDAIFVAVYRLNTDEPVNIEIESAAMSNLILKLSIAENTYRHRIPELLWLYPLNE